MPLTLANLAKTNFEIYQTFSPKKMSIKEISQNVYGYLENYPNLGFNFIQFPDEIIVLKRKDPTQHQAIFYAFGECSHQIFVQDESGKIWLINHDNEEFSSELVFVNSSLQQFIQSYQLLLSKIFILKSAVFDPDLLAKTAQQQALDLQNLIFNLDPNALQSGNFWQIYVYFIEDLVIKLSLPISAYIDSARL